MPTDPKNFNRSLDPPSTFIFTGEICSRSYALNTFAFAFKRPTHRQRFAEAPELLMESFGLTASEKDLVRRRDWTGM
jgi:gallate dioxygenase